MFVASIDHSLNRSIFLLIGDARTVRGGLRRRHFRCLLYVMALQTLPTARLLPSPNNRGTLFGDLSRFNSVIDSDDFDIKSVVPLLELAIKRAPDEGNMGYCPRSRLTTCDTSDNLK